MHAAFGHVLVHVSVCVYAWMLIPSHVHVRTCAQRTACTNFLCWLNLNRAECLVQYSSKPLHEFNPYFFMTDGPLFNQGRKGFLFNVSMSNWSFQCPNMKLEMFSWIFKFDFNMSLGSLCSSGRFVFFIPFCAPCSTKSCVRFCYYSVAYMGQFLFYNQKE